MKTVPMTILPMLCAAILVGCGGSDEKKSAAPALDPAAEAAAAEQKFETLMQQALEGLARRDGAKAATAAETALELCPESAEAVLARGQAAFLRKDAKAALVQFAAVTGEKTLPAAIRSAAWGARGVVEMSQKDHDAARLSFLRSLRLDPRNAASHYHLGRLLHEVFRFDEAAAEQFGLAAACPGVPDERVKKIREQILPSLKKSVQERLAAATGTGARDAKRAAKLVAEGDALQKKNPGAAVQKYEAAFAADRTCEAAANKLVELLPKVNKTTGVDKALDAYRVLIALRPSRLANYRSAALLAYENKRWAVAAKLLDRGVAHYPDDIPTLDLLISSLRKAGKTKEQEGWSAYRGELKEGR